jgi:hypothetical protein
MTPVIFIDAVFSSPLDYCISESRFDLRHNPLVMKTIAGAWKLPEEQTSEHLQELRKDSRSTDDRVREYSVWTLAL